MESIGKYWKVREFSSKYLEDDKGDEDDEDSEQDEGQEAVYTLKRIQRILDKEFEETYNKGFATFEFDTTEFEHCITISSL